MVTAPRPGTKGTPNVPVEVIPNGGLGLPADSGLIHVQAEEAKYVVRAEWFTPDPAPLAVGDILTAGDPEPPVGTVLIDRENVWRRDNDTDTGWYVTGDREPQGWEHVSSLPCRVIDVPAGDER